MKYALINLFVILVLLLSGCGSDTESVGETDTTSVDEVIDTIFNDGTIENPQVLTVGQSFSGKIGSDGSIYEGSYYQFIATQDGYYSIIIDSFTINADVDMALYNSESEVLSSAYGYDDTYETITYTLEAGELYYIEVDNTYDVNTNYNISISVILIDNDVVLSQNYIQNSGFEILTDDFVANWITDDNAIALTSEGPGPYTGEYFLMASYSEAEAYIYQTIDLTQTSLMTEIQNGNLNITFGGYQSGYSTQEDSGNIVISFKDVNDTIISTSQTGAFYSNHTWTKRENTIIVPSNTTTIEYGFIGIRVEGTDNDAYLDDAYVYFSEIDSEI